MIQLQYCYKYLSDKQGGTPRGSSVSPAAWVKKLYIGQHGQQINIRSACVCVCVCVCVFVFVCVYVCVCSCACACLSQWRTVHTVRNTFKLTRLTSDIARPSFVNYKNMLKNPQEIRSFLGRKIRKVQRCGCFGGKELAHHSAFKLIRHDPPISPANRPNNDQTSVAPAFALLLELSTGAVPESQSGQEAHCCPSLRSKENQTPRLIMMNWNCLVQRLRRYHTMACFHLHVTTMSGCISCILNIPESFCIFCCNTYRQYAHKREGDCGVQSMQTP